MKSVLAKYPKLKIYYVMVGGLSLICSVLLLYATNAMSTLTAHITTNGLINISIYIDKVLLLFICFHFVDHVLFRKMKSMVQKYLHQKVYCQLSDGLNRQKLNDFNESGDLYALIQSDAEDSISFLSDTFIDIIYQLIRLVMVLVYIFVINIQLSCFYVVSTMISILVQKRFSASVSKANEDTKQKEIAMNTILQNVVKNRLVIKMNDADAFAKELYEDKVNAYTDAYMNVESKALPFRMIGIFFGLFPILSLCVAGVYMVPKGLVSLRTFLSIEYICNCVVYDQLHFSDFITESAKAFVSVKRIVGFGENADTDRGHKNQTGDITIEHVSYQYSNVNKLALDDISLHVPYGSKVAIVGKSGSGKSTLLKMIASFIQQDQGVCDIPEVSFVEQFPYLFTDSVKNNITCWKKCKEDEYKHILQICKINEFLNDDQMILEKNASNLSGGQKQRIAIARALMNHKDVLLFDESFSGIDTKNALEILRKIIEEYKDQTMIFSIHQLELLEMMDRVIVMENGSIVFDGTYREYEANYGKE